MLSLCSNLYYWIEPAERDIGHEYHDKGNNRGNAASQAHNVVTRRKGKDDVKEESGGAGSRSLLLL